MRGSSNSSPAPPESHESEKGTHAMFRRQRSRDVLKAFAKVFVRWALPRRAQRWIRRTYLVRQLRLGRATCERELAYLRGTLERKDIVFDIGANIGTYTLGLAGSCQKIFSFEPIPENVIILRRVTAHLPNVTVMPYAIAEADGDRRMTIPLDYRGFTGYYLAHLSQEGIAVRARSIDSLIAEGLPTPTFIKCDVEGSAGEVIRGAVHLIESHKPKWLIEANGEDYQLMMRFGYRALVYQENLVQVETFVPRHLHFFFP